MGQNLIPKPIDEVDHTLPVVIMGFLWPMYSGMDAHISKSTNVRRGPHNTWDASSERAILGPLISPDLQTLNIAMTRVL